MTTHKWISALAVAAAVSLFALPSGAAESANDGAPSQKVKVWDLDLAKANDVATLYSRVREAANDVCRSEARRHQANTRRPPPLGWSERCVDDAIAAAVRDVGNRRLAALHTGDTLAGL